MKELTEREQLLSAVRHSRRELRDGINETREAADFTSRVKGSVKRNLVWWIGGAVVAGVCVASATGTRKIEVENDKGQKIRMPQKKIFSRSLSGLLRFLFSVSSPVLKALITREVVGALSKFDRSDS